MKWTQEQIDEAVRRTHERENGHYGAVDQWVYKALDRYAPGKIVLLVGSADQGYGPWYEGMLLNQPIWSLAVMDYNDIEYPKNSGISYLPPVACRRSDLIVSISTYEHSGLGRYGEALDVDGDLRAMQYARNHQLSIGGNMLLCVPLGKDKVVGNLHRIYGRERLPKLLQGWKLVDSFGFEDHLLDRDTDWGNPEHPEYPEYAPVLVLEKA